MNLPAQDPLFKMLGKIAVLISGIKMHLGANEPNRMKFKLLIYMA
jgi:hypothetical protein